MRREVEANGARHRSRIKRRTEEDDACGRMLSTAVEAIVGVEREEKAEEEGQEEVLSDREVR